MDKTLERVFSQYPVETYKRGKNILRADEEPRHMIYLASGYVRQFAASHQGGMLYLHVFKPGSCFPIIWLLAHVPNRYGYEAMTDVVIRKIPPQIMKTMLEDKKMLEYFLTKLLRGVDGLLARTESLVLDTAYTKTILLFLYFAKSVGVKMGDCVLIDIPLTHREVASWIGTTRETVSLQVEALLKKKLLTFRKQRFTILSVKALEAEIEISKSSGVSSSQL